MGNDKKEDEVIFSAAALGWASVGALLGLFLGAATVGYPTCIASTVIGGIFGAGLGRYLR
jgi:phosphate/sulfate permease